MTSHMAKMPDIGLLYDSDANLWSEYLKAFVEKSNVRVTIDSMGLGNEGISEEDVANFIKKSSVLVLMLSPSMCDTLGYDSIRYSQYFSGHSAVVVIQLFTQPEDLEGFDKFSEICSMSKTWKTFEADYNKDTNSLIMAEVVDIFDTLQKQRRIPPKPKPKPKPRNVNIFPKKIHKVKEAVTFVFKEETIGSIQVGFSDTDTRYDTERLNPYTCQFKAPVREFGLSRLKIYNDGREIHECSIVYVTPDIASYQCPCLLAQSLGVVDGNKQSLDAKLVELYETSVPSDDRLRKMMTNTSLKSEDTQSNFKIPTVLHFAAMNGLDEFCRVILDTPGSMALFQIENRDGKNPADLAEEEGYHELADFIRMFVETEVVVQACDDLYLKMYNSHIYTNKDVEDEDKLDYEYPDLRGLVPKPKSFKYVRKPSSEEEPGNPEESIPSVADVARKPIVGSRPMMAEPVYNTSPNVGQTPLAGGRPLVPEPQQKNVSEPTDRDSYNEEKLYSSKNELDSAKRQKNAPPVPQKPNSLKFKDQESTSSKPSPAEFMGMTGPSPTVAVSFEPVPQTDKLQSSDSKTEGGSLSQKELIDICQGVKAGEFNLDEAERLYSSWRERNTTESTSIKERKRELERMRQEYSQVFEASKTKDNDFGRLSIFGKIRKTLQKKRKKSKPDLSISKPKPPGSRYSKFPGSQQGTIPEETVSATKVTHTDPRFSTLSNASSSSSGSRDSRLSAASRESSIGESFESDSDSDTGSTEKLDSGMDSDGQNRGSMRTDFIESMVNTDVDQPPPIPPRPGRPH